MPLVFKFENIFLFSLLLYLFYFVSTYNKILIVAIYIFFFFFFLFSALFIFCCFLLYFLILFAFSFRKIINFLFVPLVFKFEFLEVCVNHKSVSSTRRVEGRAYKPVWAPFGWRGFQIHSFQMNSEKVGIACACTKRTMVSYSSVTKLAWYHHNSCGKKSSLFLCLCHLLIAP